MNGCRRFSPTGIVTTIGKQSGEVPWGKISKIAVVGDRLYIIGKSGNAFAVPRDAFVSDAEQAEFLRCATQSWNDARRPDRPTPQEDPT
jgi:hypothetical protein